MAQGKTNNFLTRVIAACILAPCVILIINLSGLYFTTMILAAAIAMGGEWYQLTCNKSKAWKLAGIPYILLPCLSLLWIIDQNMLVHDTIRFAGTNTVISIFVLVWANDIGGYIFGKLIGGPKLCAKISPNKTWAGFFGGVVCAIAVSPLVSEAFPTAGLVAMIASIGDLLESWIKRKCNAKDAGDLIPGHGGLLDRVDGILLVAVVVALGGIIVQ